MLKALADRMMRLREAHTRGDETEEERAERERLERMKPILGARYKTLPRPPIHPPVPSDEIARREDAWERI